MQSNIQFTLNTENSGVLNIQIGDDINDIWTSTLNMPMRMKDSSRLLKVDLESLHELYRPGITNEVDMFLSIQGYKYLIQSDKYDKIKYIALNIDKLTDEDLKINTVADSKQSVNILELSENLKILGENLVDNEVVYDMTTFENTIVLSDNRSIIFYYNDMPKDVIEDKVKLNKKLTLYFYSIATLMGKLK